MKYLRTIFLVLFTIALVTGCSGAKRQLAKGHKAYNQQDYHASAKSLQKSAKAGNPDAQYALGYLYFYGKGVDHDPQLARYWISKAASHGHPQATRALYLIQQEKMATSVHAHEATVKNNQPRIIRATTAVQQPTTKPSVRHVVFKRSVAKSAKETSVTETLPVEIQQRMNQEFSSDERQLMEVPGKYYTLQIMGSSSKTELMRVVSQNKLTGKAAFYQTTRKGSDWYILIYGQYKRYHDALVALRNMPKPIRKYKPWINSFARVQKAIELRHL